MHKGLIPRQLLAALMNPTMCQTWPALEKARNDAKLADCEEEFRLLWDYEVERAKTVPGASLPPEQVFHLAVKLKKMGTPD
jgi:hypothetical protein